MALSSAGTAMQNATVAQAIAGAQSPSVGGKKGKTDFSDALSAILSSHLPPQPPTAGQSSKTNDKGTADTGNLSDTLAAAPADQATPPNLPLDPTQPVDAGDNGKKHKASFSNTLDAIRSGQATAQNPTMAQAIAGAHANDKGQTSTANLSNILSTIQAGQATAQPGTVTQTNAPVPPAGAQTNDKATLALAMDPLRSNPPADTDASDPAEIATTQNATSAQSATTQTAPDVHTHLRTLTAATQAKLVSALAKAANTPAPITGSDGVTPASSNAQGTPAASDTQNTSKQPAQSETPSQVAQVLAAMQSAQPVVTTLATGVKPMVTSRTMPQLEKAALSNTAQQATHASAPAAKVEAQTLSIPLDPKAAKADADSGAQNGGDQAKDQSTNTRIAIDATKEADHQPATVNAPSPSVTAPSASLTAASTTPVNSGTSAATAGTIAQTAPVQPTTIATTLQVAQQTSGSVLAQQPDISALALSIAAKSKDGEKQFDIRMEPAELGRVDVRLSVDAAGKAQAHLTADKPQTLALLQNDKSSLERSLKDAGIDLSNNGLNFSLRGQQQNSTPTFMARNRALSISAVQTADISSISSTSTAPGDSRLDIRV